MRQFGQCIFDAKPAAFFTLTFFAAFERLERAILQFAGQFIVKAIDVRQLADVDIGNFLQLAEAFGDQQLRQRFVDIEFFLERL